MTVTGDGVVLDPRDVVALQARLESTAPPVPSDEADRAWHRFCDAMGALQHAQEALRREVQALEAQTAERKRSA